MTQETFNELEEYNDEFVLSQAERIRREYEDAEYEMQMYRQSFINNPPDEWLEDYKNNPATVLMGLNEAKRELRAAEKKVADAQRAWNGILDRLRTTDKTYRALWEKRDKAFERHSMLEDAVNGVSRDEE